MCCSKPFHEVKLSQNSSYKSLNVIGFYGSELSCPEQQAAVSMTSQPPSEYYDCHTNELKQRRVVGVELRICLQSQKWRIDYKIQMSVRDSVQGEKHARSQKQICYSTKKKKALEFGFQPEFFFLNTRIKLLSLNVLLRCSECVAGKPDFKSQSSSCSSEDKPAFLLRTIPDCTCQGICNPIFLFMTRIV